MRGIERFAVLAAMTAGFVLAGGCSDKPHGYGVERPPVDKLDSRDSGLQSADVIQASDKVVQYILSQKEFSGPTRKTIVVSGVENRTTNPSFNYDIFLQRLKSKVGQYGRDRIFLVENKDRVNQLRNKEIEGGGRDPYGQGEGGGGPVVRSVQPEYDLYLVVSELPNRGTSYYLFDFSLANLMTREVIPMEPYEVKVAR